MIKPPMGRISRFSRVISPIWTQSWVVQLALSIQTDVSVRRRMFSAPPGCRMRI